MWNLKASHCRGPDIQEKHKMWLKSLQLVLFQWFSGWLLPSPVWPLHHVVIFGSKTPFLQQLRASRVLSVKRDVTRLAWWALWWTPRWRFSCFPLYMELPPAPAGTHSSSCGAESSVVSDSQMRHVVLCHCVYLQWTMLTSWTCDPLCSSKISPGGQRLPFSLQRTLLMGVNSVLFPPSVPSSPVCVYCVFYQDLLDSAGLVECCQSKWKSNRSLFSIRRRSTDQGGITVATYIQFESTVICPSGVSLGHPIHKKKKGSKNLWPMSFSFLSIYPRYVKE